MNETTERQQIRMAGYMAAVAQILGGPDVDIDVFVDRVELIMGGSAVNLPILMAWGQKVRCTRRPVLLFSPTESPIVPLVSLVAYIDGRTHVVESCALWMGRNDERASLVPDNMRCGAFVFDNDLQLRHLGRAPARNLDAAGSGMARAYNRLLDLEIDMRAKSAALRLPSLHRLAA